MATAYTSTIIIFVSPLTAIEWVPLTTITYTIGIDNTPLRVTTPSAISSTSSTSDASSATPPSQPVTLTPSSSRTATGPLVGAVCKFVESRISALPNNPDLAFCDSTVGGVAAGIVLAVAVLFFVYRHRKRSKHKSTMAHNTGDQSYPWESPG